MRATKKKRFNSRLYFYYVNNRIDPLVVTVDSSRVPLIVVKGQSYAELPKELWDRTKHTERCERAILSESRQSNISCATQLGGRERSYLTRTESLRLLSRARSKGKERMRLPITPLFQRQGGVRSFRSYQGTTTQVGEVCSGVNQPTRFNIQIRYRFGSTQAFQGYIDWSVAPKSSITWIGSSGTYNTLFLLFLLTAFLLINYN